MITLLLVLGLTFIQDDYSYQSDVIKYVQEKNYVVCEENNDRCCSGDIKKSINKKNIKRDNVVLSRKATPEVNRKNSNGIFIPLENIMVTLKKDPLVNERGDINEDISTRTISHDEGVNKTAPAVHVKEGSINKEFAIAATGYYKPEEEEALLEKISAGEESHEKSIVDTMEINFLLDEAGLYLVNADKVVLDHINENYQGNSVRLTSYAQDEDEAFLLIILIFEAIERNIIIDDIELVEDESKKTVVIEVIESAI